MKRLALWLAMYGLTFGLAHWLFSSLLITDQRLEVFALTVAATAFLAPFNLVIYDEFEPPAQKPGERGRGK